MSDSAPELDDWDLYPNSIYKEYAPTGWVVYEVKNATHVIFEHTATGDLVHAEADGMMPLVSLFQGRDLRVKRGADTWEDALVLAGDLMTAYTTGTAATEDELVVPRAAVVEIVDDAFIDITDGYYVGDHRTAIATAVADIYEALGNEDEAEQAHAIANTEWGSAE